MVRLIMGELGSELLESQRVVPEKIMEEGFEFKYKEINKALDNQYYQAINTGYYQ